MKDEYLKTFSINIVFSLKNQKILGEISLGPKCEEYFDELMQEQKDVVTVVRKNCLNILCDGCIRISHNKCLPISNFLSKLQVFTSL